jgi:hypothetical protein
MMDFIAGAADQGARVVDARIKDASETSAWAERMNMLTPILQERERAAAELRTSMAEQSAARERERVAGVINGASNARTVIDEATGAVASQPLSYAERMRGATDALVGSGDLHSAAQTASIGAKKDEVEALAAKERIESMRQNRLDSRQEFREDARDERQQRYLESLASRQGRGLTEPQRVKNFEIEAARRIVGQLSPEEMKRKTQKFTNSGRENPDYDESLANRVRIAAKRKYGEDSDFDAQLDPATDAAAPVKSKPGATPPAVDAGIQQRFQADPAMRSYKLGKVTDRGQEVLDSNGRLVGHYQ